MCIYSENRSCYLVHGNSNGAYYTKNLKGLLDLPGKKKKNEIINAMAKETKQKKNKRTWKLT